VLFRSVTTIAGLTSVTSTAFTGSLLGTASFATNALSSSFATTASFASNGISGLTTNFIPKATSATALGNSIIQDTGTNVRIGGSLEVTGSLIVSSSGAQVYGTLQALSDVIVDGTTVWQGKAVMASLTSPKGGIVSYTTNTDILGYTTNQWTGEAISGVAGDNIIAGQLCYMDTNGEWKATDADTLISSTPLLGICLLTAAAGGDPTFILLKGFIRTTYAAGATSGEPLYIEPGTGTGPGFMNFIAPTAPGQVVRIIGHTYSGNRIRFNPDNIWVEL
jgi:hypothetical protein